MFIGGVRVFVGEAKPSKTHGTLKVSCICVTKGMEPLRE